MTVSTNMAGRGTDILLGGNPEAMTREYFLKNKLAIPYAPASAVIGAAPGTETAAQADAAAASSAIRGTSIASTSTATATTTSASTSTSTSTGGSNGSSATASAMVLFQQEGKIYQVPLDQWKPIFDQFAEQCKAEHDEVVAMGGLHILGTERHEARRIDNQLRGCAGRQGDPGASRFFLLA